MRARLRAAATRTLRRVDHSLGRLLSPARVLVDVRTPMNLAVLRPIWTRLQTDPRVRVSFTSEPGTGVAEAVGSEGLGAALISRDSAGWARFDLSMTADLWNRTDLRRCRRRINFFHGVAGKYDLDNPEKLGAADLGQFDRIAFINADRMQRY